MTICDRMREHGSEDICPCYRFRSVSCCVIWTDAIFTVCFWISIPMRQWLSTSFINKGSLAIEKSLNQLATSLTLFKNLPYHVLISAIFEQKIAVFVTHRCVIIFLNYDSIIAISIIHHETLKIRSSSPHIQHGYASTENVSSMKWVLSFRTQRRASRAFSWILEECDGDIRHSVWLVLPQPLSDLILRFSRLFDSKLTRMDQFKCI